MFHSKKNWAHYPPKQSHPGALQSLGWWLKSLILDTIYTSPTNMFFLLGGVNQYHFLFEHIQVLQFGYLPIPIWVLNNATRLFTITLKKYFIFIWSSLSDWKLWLLTFEQSGFFLYVCEASIDSCSSSSQSCKMVPKMAASLPCSLVLCWFCSVSCNPSLITFNREVEDLLNIWQSSVGIFHPFSLNQKELQRFLLKVHQLSMGFAGWEMSRSIYNVLCSCEFTWGMSARWQIRWTAAPQLR